MPSFSTILLKRLIAFSRFSESSTKIVAIVFTSFLRSSVKSVYYDRFAPFSQWPLVFCLQNLKSCFERFDRVLRTLPSFNHQYFGAGQNLVAGFCDEDVVFKADAA